MTDKDGKTAVPEPAKTGTPTPTGQPPAKPTPAEVLDADALVNSIIADLPGLAQAKPALKQVAALISYHRFGYPAAKALSLLKMAGFKPAVIKAGIDILAKGADRAAESHAKAFFETTGRQLDTVSLDPSSTTNDELVEQATYRQAAVELRARVNNVRIGLYGKGKNRGKVEEWIGKAKTRAESLVYEPAGNVSTELPGWKTPPKLDTGNTVVKALLDQLVLIEQHLADFGANALSQLKNIGFTDQVVAGVLDACEALADQQIVQSDAIKHLAETESVAFVATAAKIAANRAIAKEADDYMAEA